MAASWNAAQNRVVTLTPKFPLKLEAVSLVIIDPDVTTRPSDAWAGFLEGVLGYDTRDQRGKFMKPTAAALFALPGLLIATARAAEPTGTLTLACKGQRTTWGAPNTDPVKEQVSMGVIVNLTAWTVNGLGSDWRDPIPIHTITETAITFFAERQDVPVEASIIGTIDRITGDVDAGSRCPGRPEK